MFKAVLFWGIIFLGAVFSSWLFQDSGERLLGRFVAAQCLFLGHCGAGELFGPGLRHGSAPFGPTDRRSVWRNSAGDGGAGVNADGTRPGNRANNPTAVTKLILH